MKQNQGPIILLSLIAIAIAGIICNVSSCSVSKTIGDFPDELAGAAATRTAIAPAIVPTVRYNEVVLPTQQAEEANQITETTRRKYENKRNWDDSWFECKRVVVKGATILANIGMASLAGAIVGAALCYIIERVKRMLAYEPIQVVQSKPFLVPQWKMLVEPRTGLAIPYTTEHEASVEHGTLLIEARTGKKQARWRITPRQ